MHIAPFTVVPAHNEYLRYDPIGRARLAKREAGLAGLGALPAVPSWLKWGAIGAGALGAGWLVWRFLR